MSKNTNSTKMQSRRAPDLPVDDRERLGKLLIGLEPRLTAVALRFTRDPESARDVVQNAYEKAIRHGRRFRGESRVSTWLHRIVANEALMWLRSQRRRHAVQTDNIDLETGAIPDPRPATDAELDRRRALFGLRLAITRLRREEREVVMDCSLGGWSYAEYGAKTGTHRDAVKSRAFRARQRLAAMLES